MKIKVVSTCHKSDIWVLKIKGSSDCSGMVLYWKTVEISYGGKNDNKKL